MQFDVVCGGLLKDSLKEVMMTMIVESTAADTTLIWFVIINKTKFNIQKCFLVY